MTIGRTLGQQRGYGGGSFGTLTNTAYFERTASLWTGAYTVCGWAKLDTTIGGLYKCLFAAIAGAGNNSFFGYSTTQLVMRTTADSTMPGGSWSAQPQVFWAVTDLGDGSASSCTGYIRRAQENAFSSVARISIVGTVTAFRFAKSVSSDGMISRHWDIRMWDAVLSERELKVESINSTPRRLTNLRGWYPMRGNYQSGTYSGQVMRDYGPDRAHMLGMAGNVQQIYGGDQSARRQKRDHRLVMRGVAEASTRVPIWALTNSLRSRQHV